MAPSHVSVDYEDFLGATSKGGLDVYLICQPPNSPNLNYFSLF